MIDLTLNERNLCASEFLNRHLTSRERVLVAAYTLGFSPSEVAAKLQVSAPAVTQMARRIMTKAKRFWNN